MGCRVQPVADKLANRAAHQQRFINGKKQGLLDSGLNESDSNPTAGGPGLVKSTEGVTEATHVVDQAIISAPGSSIHQNSIHSSIQDDPIIPLDNDDASNSLSISESIHHANRPIQFIEVVEDLVQEDIGGNIEGSFTVLSHRREAQLSFSVAEDIANSQERQIANAHDEVSQSPDASPSGSRVSSGTGLIRNLTLQFEQSRISTAGNEGPSDIEDAAEDLPLAAYEDPLEVDTLTLAEGSENLPQSNKDTAEEAQSSAGFEAEDDIGLSLLDDTAEELSLSLHDSERTNQPAAAAHEGLHQVDEEFDDTSNQVDSGSDTEHTHSSVLDQVDGDHENASHHLSVEVDLSWQSLEYEPLYEVENIKEAVGQISIDLSITHLTDYWNTRFPPDLTLPLMNSDILPRDGSYSDYQRIRWRDLLAGDPDNRPGLNLQISEEDSPHLKSLDSIDIDRRWDVDSFLARATSLAVHREGFDLSYQPPYLRRITQNPYIQFNGHDIQQLKNIQIGQGLASAGFGYHCHVIFPHMQLGNDGGTHLTYNQQRIWYDKMILPALEAVCYHGLPQHHPCSYEDAYTKAMSKKELYLGGNDQPMNFKYTIPAAYLDDFWTEVLRLANTVPSYHEPFLMIQGHNLKLYTQREEPVITKTSYINHLHTIFDLTHVPFQDAWIDLGMEDNPVAHPPAGITLLRKCPCLDHWMEHFQCPDPSHASPLTKEHVFPWNLTRDAAAATVMLSKTNQLRADGGIAYHKAYNLEKDLWNTPMKGLKPFDLAQLEGLAYSQELLDKWYTSNSGGQTSAYPHKRQQLKETYELIKRWLYVAIEEAAGTSFGVRQEYRINLEVFHTVSWCGIGPVRLTQSNNSPSRPHSEASHSSSQSNNNHNQQQAKSTWVDLIQIDQASDRSDRSEEDLAAPPSGVSYHRPFYILSTSEVHKYLTANIN
ncbi:MAG: hypothetical protein M1827_006224 [Pycnora praestabilis]|nr:MAG: hypothetical protein M1827_006224 [Pycnora praestabilis]